MIQTLQYIQNVMKKVCDLGLFPADCEPNHVLVNVYEPGQGIMVRFIKVPPPPLA